MTREDIIRMAQECGFGGQARVTNLKRLEQFATLVAEAEREACAKVCEGWLHADGDQCADAIRARGNE